MKLPKLKLSGSSLVNVIGSVIIIYLLVVLAQTVKRNYDLGRQLETFQAQISLLQDQKDQLSYSLQYYNTDSFHDREARAKLGLQLPGENVIIIPSSKPAPAAPANSGKTPARQSNFQQWLDFLAGRR